jgi:hypothetical protein
MYDGRSMPLTLALKMCDMAKQKAAAIESGQGGIFKEHVQQKNKALCIDETDFMVTRHGTSATQAPSAHAMLQGDVTNKKMAIYEPQQNMDKSVMTADLKRSMSMVNRKMGPREMKDLRGAVQQAAAVAAPQMDQTNRKMGAVADDNQLAWQSTHTAQFGDSMKTANYKRMADNMYLDKPASRDALVDHDMPEHSELAQRKLGNHNTMYVPDNVHHDNEFGTNTAHAKMVGGMGKKYTRRSMIADHLDTVNDCPRDVTAVTRRT